MTHIPDEAVLKRHELVEERFPDIVHLTHAGRATLAQGGVNDD